MESGASFQLYSHVSILVKSPNHLRWSGSSTPLSPSRMTKLLTLSLGEPIPYDVWTKAHFSCCYLILLLTTHNSQAQVMDVKSINLLLCSSVLSLVSIILRYLGKNSSLFQLRIMASELEILTFIVVASQLAENHYSASQRSLLDEVNKTTSSAKNREDIQKLLKPTS